MYIKANENTAIYNDATIDISGVLNALADNQGTTKLSSNKIIHQGTQFQAVQSSTTQSSISLKNTDVNTNQILFKSQENRVTNTYDAYQKATGVTSIYNSPGLLGTDIFSGNTTGNSCGTWGVMASKIDIGNQADEILISTNALGGMGFDADIPATSNFKNIIKIHPRPTHRSPHPAPYVQALTFALSRLASGKPEPYFDDFRPALSILAKLLSHSDERVVANACWVLRYLSDGANYKIQAVMDTAITPRLVDLMTPKRQGEGGSDSVSGGIGSATLPALYAIGNFVSGTEKQTQVVLGFDTLPSLLALYDYFDTSPGASGAGVDADTAFAVKKRIVWTLSNIAGGTVAQAQAVIDAGCFQKIMQVGRVTRVIQTMTVIVDSDDSPYYPIVH